MIVSENNIIDIRKSLVKKANYLIGLLEKELLLVGSKDLKRKDIVRSDIRELKNYMK